MRSDDPEQLDPAPPRPLACYERPAPRWTSPIFALPGITFLGGLGFTIFLAAPLTTWGNELLFSLRLEWGLPVLAVWAALGMLNIGSLVLSVAISVVLRRRFGRCEFYATEALFYCPWVADPIRLPLTEVKDRVLTPWGVILASSTPSMLDVFNLPLLVPTSNGAELAEVLCRLDEAERAALETAQR